jgi:hypothetical protein
MKAKNFGSIVTFGVLALSLLLPMMSLAQESQRSSFSMPSTQGEGNTLWIGVLQVKIH